MLQTLPKRFAALACLYFVSMAPAFAHVKWFLGRSEAEILREPKPELFLHPCFANVVPVICAVCVLIASVIMGREWSRSLVHRLMTHFAIRLEDKINLFMGLTTGASLIYCAANHFLLAPNFIICSHCPWWLAPAECLTGLLLFFGLFTRFAAVAFLGLLGYTFLKHSMADCLDLVPLYGLAFYFLLAGRNHYSLDNLFKRDQVPSSKVIELGHVLVRLATGIGLMILGFDEKLCHPQLALELMKHAPTLNFMGQLNMSNDMFIFCAGLVEVVLGMVLVVGSFPRIAVLMLAGVFAATTLIFGTTELVGHMAYYGIICSVVMRGRGSESAWGLCSGIYAGIVARLRQARRQRQVFTNAL